MARDATEDLRSFLTSNTPSFDTSNISVTFSTSDIEHANYDQGPKYPSVAIVSEDPTIPGGGETDLTGIDPSGAGNTQDQITSILVDCWGGTHETQLYQDEGSNPSKVAKELAWEVHRVCFEASPSQAPTDYTHVNATPPSSAHDTQASPVARRFQTVCYLRHVNRP